MVSETALSCSESPGSFLLLRRLPRKETRSRAAHFFSKDGLRFNCSVWLSLFLPPRPGWLTGLCSWIFFSDYRQGGRKSRQRWYICSLSGKAKAPPSTLQAQECIQRNPQKAPTPPPICPREIASFCNPLFTYVQVRAPVEGESSWGKVRVMNAASLQALTSRKCSACCSRSSFREVVVIRPVWKWEYLTFKYLGQAARRMWETSPVTGEAKAAGTVTRQSLVARGWSQGWSWNNVKFTEKTWKLCFWLLFSTVWGIITLGMENLPKELLFFFW